MKKVLLSLILLMSSALFAQTRYSSFGSTENLPYGMISEVFNPTANTIYLDSAQVTGSAVLPLPRGSNATLPVSFLAFSFGLTNAVENQCVSVPVLIMGGNSAVSANTGIQVITQPCTPNGMAYGIPLGNGMFNYTPLNFLPLQICADNNCSIDFSGKAVAIPPNTGLSIQTFVYDGVNAFGWTGYAYFSFRWHDHTGCPTNSTNPLCIQ